ncbi:PAS domain-containing sensor histidine kinase [Bacteroidota bacterium]
MAFKRFVTQIIIRVIFLFISLLALAFVIVREERLFSIIILSTIIIIQIIFLIIYVSKTNMELKKFLLAIKHSDLTMKFPENKVGSKFDELYEIFSSILNSLKDARIEKEAQFYYLRMIIENAKIGIIALDKENKIMLINDAVKNILGLIKIESWDNIQKSIPQFVKEAEAIKVSGSRLVRIVTEGSEKELSLQVNTFKIIDKYIRLLTFHNIGSEIEQKETEAWQKLIRTIAHEIMNSVTPISSLTETGVYLLEDNKGLQKPISEITENDITSLRTALKTIEKRSKGLYNFVDDYRKIAKVPIPQINNYSVSEILDSITSLMHEEINKSGIELLIRIEPLDLKINADHSLIEQVLINLINNSISALNGINNPIIKIVAKLDETNLIMVISDNGKGIPEDKIDKVFVPFYTTKKDGSGIGLSLSRQILQLHNASISVASKPGVETVFTLKF